MYMEKVDTALGKDPSFFWKYVKSKTKTLRVPVEVEYEGNKACDERSCAEMFSRYFKSKFSPVVRHSTPLPSVTSLSEDCLSTITISSGEIELQLQSLKNGKSSGPDDIPVNVLKYCRTVISRPQRAYCSPPC